MNNFSPLFFFYFIFCATSLFAQTNEPVFDYKQENIIELLNDSTWAKNSTEKYAVVLEDRLAHKKIDSLSYLIKKTQSDVILNQYGNGSAITDSISGTHPGDPIEESYFAIMYAYFIQAIQQNKQAYIPAVKAAYKKAGASDFDWYLMKGLMNPDGHYGDGTIIGYATPDKTLLQQYFKSRIKSFKNGGGNFLFEEMGDVIRTIAFIKVSNAIKEENSKLMIEIAASQTLAYKNVAKVFDNTLTAMFPAMEPGAAIVLMKGDKIVLQKGYGIADINTKKKIDVHTNFNIASISKMFTATAILLLKQENKLSLQDPIIKYLPDVNPKIGYRIKIYNLLTHSSGLPRYVPTKDSLKGLIVMDRDTYNDDKNIDSLDFEPGTKFSYSNIGYRWLSLIVENVSGMKFGDFVRKNILLRADMKNSYELNRDKPIPDFAHAYKKSDKTFSEFDYGEEQDFSTLGDGGIVTNITDFAAWEKALRTNKVLSKKVFDESIQPHIESDEPGTYYGYGWFIETSKEHTTAYSHSGENGAFISYFLRVPAKNIMCAIFMNRDDKGAIINYIQAVLKDAKWY